MMPYVSKFRKINESSDYKYSILHKDDLEMEFIVDNEDEELKVEDRSKIMK